MDNQLIANNPILDNQPEARQAGEEDARAARAAAAADNNRRPNRVVDFVARPARGNGPAFTDERWSCGFTACFIVWVFVTFGGLLAFIIPAGIFSVRFLASTRPESVPAYNAAVSSWISTGLPAAQSIAGSYKLGIDAVTGQRNLSVQTGSPSLLTSRVVGERPLVTDGEMSSYPTSILWSGAAQVVPYGSTYSGAGILAGNFSLYLVDAATSTVVSTTDRIQVPVLFKVSVGSNCAGSVTGDGCVCPGSTTLNGATRKCEGFAALAAICLVATVDTTGALKLSTDTPVGAGCAAGPAVFFDSAPSSPVWVPVPQLDACLPTAINNVAPFAYSVTANQPSALGIEAVPVYIRAAGDPYVTALSATRVTLDSDGAVWFGTPAAQLEAVAAGTWFGFALCFTSLAMYMMCVCTALFDAPLNAMAAARNWSTPIAMGIGAAVGSSRSSKCCRGAVESSVTAAITVIFLVTLVAYSYLAFVLLDAPYVTAFKSVGCGEGIDVVVSQGTLKDLQASSSVGSNFRGLTIGAISLALIPVGCFIGIGGMTAVSGGAAAVLFVGLVLVFMICAPLSGLLQIAAAGVFAASKQSMADAYCSYVVSSLGLVTPDYCSIVDRTATAFTAQTVIGLICTTTACFLAAAFKYAKRR